MTTKRSFRILISIILFGNAALANGQVSFGIKAGPNINLLRIVYPVPMGYSGDHKQPDLNGSGVGVHFGFCMNTSGPEARVGLDLELLYSLRATSSDYDYTLPYGPEGLMHYAGQVKHKLGYMEMPVLLSVRVLPELSILGGMVPAVRLMGSAKDVGEMTLVSATPPEPAQKYNIRLNDSSLSAATIAAAIAASFEVTKVGLEIRYVKGLSNIANVNKEDLSAQIDILQFSVRYMFGGQ